MARVMGVLRDFHFPRLWLGIWIFGWMLCIVLSLIRPPDLGLEVQHSDKIGHVLAYALLSAWSVCLFSRARARWMSALALISLGLALEWAQGALTAYRMLDMRDAIANTLGVLLGQGVAITPGKDLFSHAESWWRSRD